MGEGVGEGACEARRHGVADLAVLGGLGAGKGKAAWEGLEGGGLGDGEAAHAVRGHRWRRRAGAEGCMVGDKPWRGGRNGGVVGGVGGHGGGGIDDGRAVASHRSEEGAAGGVGVEGAAAAVEEVSAIGGGPEVGPAGKGDARARHGAEFGGTPGGGMPARAWRTVGGGLSTTRRARMASTTVWARWAPRVAPLSRARPMRKARLRVCGTSKSLASTRHQATS